MAMETTNVQNTSKKAVQGDPDVNTKAYTQCYPELDFPHPQLLYDGINYSKPAKLSVSWLTT